MNPPEYTTATNNITSTNEDEDISNIAPLTEAPVETDQGPLPDIIFLDQPIFIVCPACDYKGMSKVDRVRGCCSTLLCCLSFCCTCFNDYQHTCPQCRTVLGSYEVI